MVEPVDPLRRPVPVRTSPDARQVALGLVVLIAVVVVVLMLATLVVWWWRTFIG